MKILKNPQLMTFEQLVNEDKLASLSFGYGHFLPAVGRETNGKGYYIRLLQSQYSHANGTTKTSWEYFNLDENGVIIQSPRGTAARYNGRVKINIESLEKAVIKYKEKRINQ